MIAVDDLADAIVALALHGARLPSGRVLHANHPAPVRVRDVITTVARALDLPLPQGSVSDSQALELFGAPNDPTGARRLSLLAVDHWYESSALWKLTGAEPGPGFLECFAPYAAWYRAAVAAAAAGTAARSAG